jgi:hypothetical protein
VACRFTARERSIEASIFPASAPHIQRQDSNSASQVALDKFVPHPAALKDTYLCQLEDMCYPYLASMCVSSFKLEDHLVLRQAAFDASGAPL